MMEELGPIVQIFGIGTALLGVGYAIFEKDTKRMLALSTISQLGFVIAAPVAAGFYALTHGLAKASLFLIAGNLPSRNFQILRQNPIKPSFWIALVIASFSISGLPLLAGFEAKSLTLKQLDSWQAIAMNIAAVGTAIVFAKFIFLPFKAQPSELQGAAQLRNSGFWLAITPLLGGLVAANGLSYQAYTTENLVKALITIGIGWLAYFLIFQRFALKLPRLFEQFEHLIGVMSLMLTLLFLMVLT